MSYYRIAVALYQKMDKISQIVKGCKCNDRRSQRQLYEHCFSDLLALCRRYTGDNDVILTIINDGMLKVFKHIDTFDISRAIKPWVRTIVFRSLSDYFRKDKSIVRVLMLEDFDQGMSATTILDDLGYEDLLGVVELLPPMSKRVFILYAIEGYMHCEIAKQLGISIGTSKWHLSTARKKLQALLIEQKRSYETG